MKILLVGINAKYIHSNLAVYSLRAAAVKYLRNRQNVDIAIAEYTINQTEGQIIKGIYKARPDLIGISCYIWNVTMVEKITAELRKLFDGVPIWIGGPEVSFDLEWQMRRFPAVTGIMYGEGEGTFPKLIEAYLDSDYDTAPDGICGEDLEGRFRKRLKNINGIVYRGLGNGVEINPPAEIADLDGLPFPYDNMEDFQNRIIYYETSRGCPYSCAYCLSSVEKELRFRSFNKVSAELQAFLDAKVKQVKFVDRTFNCNRAHAAAVLQYIKENDNGVTNFHFEVAGDLLTDEEIKLAGTLRPGLIQLEIGVQSANEKALKAVRRRTDLERLKQNVRLLLKNGNVRLHLDLIAGLPYENMDSFIRSFNEVYRMGGHELQLGFLKLLRGTSLMRMKEEYGIVCTDFPPYETLYTRELSFDGVLRLKAVEEMLEIYHNSGQFRRTERFVMPAFASPFDFYEGLAKYYETKEYPVVCSARVRRYEILLEFIEECLKAPDGRTRIKGSGYGSGDRADSEYQYLENKEKFLKTVREFLTLDYYLRERAKARPSFAPDEKGQYRKLLGTDAENVANREYGFREWKKAVCRKYEKEPEQGGRQREGETHLEILHYAAAILDVPLPQVILFDYRERSPVTGEVKMTAVFGENGL